MAAPHGNTYAQSGETRKDTVLHIRAETAHKDAWVRCAEAKNLPTAVWVTDVLNKAARKAL